MALSRWIAAARSGGTITVFGSLRRTRDITEVRDVVDALMRLAVVGVGRTVNIGTGRGVTLGELVEAVVDAIGTGTEVEVVPAAPEEVPATLADTSTLRRLVGLVPVTDLRGIVERQIGHETTKRSEVLV
jgi:UDP-glucuronate 4-epimerase